MRFLKIGFDSTALERSGELCLFQKSVEKKEGFSCGVGAKASVRVTELEVKGSEVGREEGSNVAFSREASKSDVVLSGIAAFRI